MPSVNLDLTELAEIARIGYIANKRALVSLQVAELQIKEAQRRVDLSLDIFSQFLGLHSIIHENNRNLGNDITSSSYFIPTDFTEEETIILNENSDPEEGAPLTQLEQEVEYFLNEAIIEGAGIFDVSQPQLDGTLQETESAPNNPNANETPKSPTKRKKEVPEKEDEQDEAAASKSSKIESPRKRQSPEPVRAEIPGKKKKDDDSMTVDVKPPQRILESVQNYVGPPLKIWPDYESFNRKEESLEGKTIGSENSNGVAWLPVASLEKEDLPLNSRIRFKWSDSGALVEEEGIVYGNWKNYVELKRHPGGRKLLRVKAKMSDVKILSRAQACSLASRN